MEANSTHFTTFAALFGPLEYGIDRSECGPSPYIWIGCLVAVGIVLCLGITFVIAARRVPIVKGFVYGYVGQSMESIDKTLKKAAAESKRDVTSH